MEVQYVARCQLKTPKEKWLSVKEVVVETAGISNKKIVKRP